MKQKRKRYLARAKRVPTTAGKSSSADSRKHGSRLATLGEVSRVLSHETRNIVGSFTTCLELLRRNPQLNKDDRELVDILQSGAGRLNEIVDQFAAFGPRPSPRFEPVDLAEIINGVVQRLRSNKRCPDAISITTRFDASIGKIPLDRAQVANVFWNLFLNAVQAMGDQGMLEIETKRSGARVEIYVRDSGPGIPASLQGKIFEPLFTTKTRATGLGLAIASLIIEEHGGNLQLHRDRERATCFIVTLPSISCERIDGGPDTKVAHRRRAPHTVTREHRR